MQNENFITLIIKNPIQSEWQVYRVKQKLILYFISFYLQKSIKFCNFLLRMNRNTIVGIEQSQIVLEQETIQRKKFLYDSLKVDYCNTSKIFSENKPSISDIRVNNFLCYQEGSTLCKVTEILYEDKLIRIEDKFEVSQDCVKLGSRFTEIEEKFQQKEKKSSRNIQKVRLFCKNMNEAPCSDKKDKKNIVKNIIKIFICWLQKKSEKNSSNNALDQLIKLMRIQKYNNRLVKKIACSPQISREFLKFLMDCAVEEIKYSRIKDKQSHYEALEIYKELISNNMNGCQPSKQGAIQNSSNDQQSSDPSENNLGSKIQPTSHNTFVESGSNSNSKGDQSKVQTYVETLNECRKNKIILVHNGVELYK